ncbi:hypothetical protein [Hoeflea sp. TYP-13]|uniref:hypothetical protein n=1 Tax=Hoeflea sp. TYP-13 TaxID=3230023 RepID=UPI0034C6306E
MTALSPQLVFGGIPHSDTKQPDPVEVIRLLNAISVGAGDEVVKTADYTIVANDGRANIVFNSATPVTASLTAAATIVAGLATGTTFLCNVFNIGAGSVTIDPDGSETINGAATAVLRQYESAALWTEGTEWRAALSPASLNIPTDVATRSAMKALNTAKDTVAILTESGREGMFIWIAADYSTQIAADTQEGVYLKADTVASSAGAWVRVYVGAVDIRWFGAIGDNTTDCEAAIEGAVAVADRILVPEGTFYVAAAVTIPESRSIEFVGENPRQTVLTNKGGAYAILSFVRVTEAAGTGSVLFCRDIHFLGDAVTPGTSAGIEFKGPNSTYHDNWLRCYDCWFSGLSKGIDAQYMGRSNFVRCHTYDCGHFFVGGRDCSFLWFDECFGINNTGLLYLDDPTPDGTSNGVWLRNCSSVFASEVDYRIKGWQAVYMYNCSADLGGTAATNSSSYRRVYFEEVTDFVINGCWFATNDALAPNQDGVYLNACHSGSITHNSIYNSRVNLYLDGSASFKSRLRITHNTFSHDEAGVDNTINHIIALDNITASVIAFNNFHTDVFNRGTGTNFPIYANTTGTNELHITDNILAGADYAIVAGAASVVTRNTFLGGSFREGFFNAAAVVQPAGAGQAAVTLGNTDNEIGGLTFSATPTQAEVEALRDKCEELADDLRNMHTLQDELRTALVNLGLIKGAA